jgi:hypothetical protein
MQAHLAEELFKSLVQLPLRARQDKGDATLPRHFLFNFGATAKQRVEMLDLLTLLRGPDVTDIENGKLYATVFASTTLLQSFVRAVDAEQLPERFRHAHSAVEMGRVLRGEQQEQVASEHSGGRNKARVYEGLLLNPRSSDLGEIASDLARAPELDLCRVVLTKDYWFA